MTQPWERDANYFNCTAATVSDDRKTVWVEHRTLPGVSFGTQSDIETMTFIERIIRDGFRLTRLTVSGSRVIITATFPPEPTTSSPSVDENKSNHAS